MKIWIDGTITGPEQARIPVIDHGLLYGDGVFEGMRIYGGKVFRLDDHMRRIGTAMRALGLEPKGGTGTLETAVLETARAHGKAEAYVRLLVTRGDGPLGVDPLSCPSPRVICMVDDVHLYPAEKLRSGLAMITSSYRRPSADMLDPRVKSLNYLNSVLAKREARMAGADEALLLNAAGLVAEAAVANVFVVKDGAITTPPVTDGALEGITRASVMEIAAGLNIATSERSLGRFDLFAADEIFLTGSGARVVPVGRFDHQPIGPGTGFPITEQLANAFTNYAQSHGTRF